MNRRGTTAQARSLAPSFLVNAAHSAAFNAVDK